MRIITPHLIVNRTVLLRMILNVPLKETTVDGKIKMVVADDTRLKTCLPTLFLCLEYAKKVIIMGHVGRPKGKFDPKLSVAPIVEWLDNAVPDHEFPPETLQVLENLRFEKGEDECDEGYAKELAKLGDVYINEAFPDHHKAASTTVLPGLLPHAAGFHFYHEVQTLMDIRNKPKKPLVGIIGGTKTEDKYPAVLAFSKFCDAVLVGGLLPKRIIDEKLKIPENVVLAELSEEGTDISEKSIKAFSDVISHSKQIIWAGPMGKYEEEKSNKGTLELAKAALKSGAEIIIGGGDTIAALEAYHDKFDFVSIGGGAMLNLLVDGTLPTIEALK